MLDTGAAVGLGNYRGKYLVLDLRLPPDWGMPDDPPRLGAAWDRFAGDPRFSFLTLCVGKRAEAPKAGLNVGRPERWAAAAMSQVSPPYLSLPSNTSYVIDAEGRLLGKWQDGRGVFSLLDNAASGPAPQPRGVTVVADHNAPDAATAGFKFPRVGPIRSDDAARAAVFSVVDGKPFGGAGLAVLNDGKGPTGNNEPAAAFFFDHWTLTRRLRADLGRVAPIREINTYSWHTNTRCPQVFRVYGSDGAASNFEPAPKIGMDPGRCGWNPIAWVDTRPKDVQPNPTQWGGQDAVSVRASGAATLGRYRYLLFVTFVTETGDGYGHTFFNEIDVVTEP